MWGIPIVGIFVICAALRLGRFNIQAGTSAGKTRFVGLPVPGAAAVIAGILFGYQFFGLNSPRALCAVMIVITLVLAGLMVSRLPYPALKSVDLRARKFEIGLALFIAAILLVLAPRLAAFVAGAAYLISGPVLALTGEHIEEISSD
jgi:CDP-diacylglycerol--serine O-phosphatidyltransferase